MNVVHAFSVFYDTEIIPLFFSLLQCFFYLLAIAATARWMLIVRERQNVGRFRMDLLTVEEFTFLQYWIPSLLYAPIVLIWNLSTGDYYWKTQSASTLIYYVSVSCLAAAVIIGEL